MNTLIIDNKLLDTLLTKANDNPRFRLNYDLRTGVDDKSQRMLNALLPGTEVAIHRHPNSSESVICLCGRMDEVIYEEVVSYLQDGEDTVRKVSYQEIERIHLNPKNGVYACQVPKGAWHTVEVYEPSVIFEAKDIKYEENVNNYFTTC